MEQDVGKYISGNITNYVMSHNRSYILLYQRNEDDYYTKLTVFAYQYKPGSAASFSMHFVTQVPLKDAHAMTTVKRKSEKFDSDNNSHTKLVDYIRIWAINCFVMRSPACTLTLVKTFQLQALRYGHTGWRSYVHAKNEVGAQYLHFDPGKVDHTIRNVNLNP
jgi:hypothetical protein